MKEKYITYKTSDGRTFDVPESYSAVVEHDYPDATIEMRLGDRIFDVPVSSKEDVLKSYGNQIRYSFEDKPESQTSSMMSEPASAFEDTKEEPISFATTPAEKKKKPSFWERVGESMIRAQNEGFANPQKAEELSGQIGSVQGQGQGKDNGPSVLESLVKGSGAGWTIVGQGLMNALHVLSSNTLYNDPETGEAKKTESYDEQMADETNTFRNATVSAMETADRLSKEADPTGGEMGFVDLISEGKFGMAMQKGLATMAESMPMTLSAYNPYTMALNMISMAGSNYAEQTLENPEIDAWKRGVYAVGSAAFEQAVEKFADPVFQYIGGGKGAKKITEELAKEIIEKGTKEATENIYKQILKRIGKVGVNTLKGAGGEGLEEVITSGGTDALGAALDFIDGNKDYGFSAQWEQYKKQNPDASKEDFAWAKAKEYADSFIGGALSGAYMSGAASSANEIATSRMESQDRKQMNAARAKGSTLGLANMYDLDEAVKEQADATETVFTDESGEKLLSRDFIDNMSSEDAFNLSLEEDLSNKQKIALRQLANAKAMEEGLTTSLDNSLASTINAQKANIEKATENGKIVVGTVNGQPVYVKGAVVQNGSLTLPTGENGPVIIINAATGEQSSVNTNEIENFTSRDAAEYTGWVETMFTDKDQQDRQTARTTMSVGAKLKAVTPYAGKKMYVDFGNGLIEVGVQRVLPTGEVIIQGKKGDLGGQSIKTMGVDAFYDSIYRDENGNPIFTDGELEPIESQPAEAPVGTAEANDYRGQAVTIFINGKPVEVEVTSQDNTSDRITYEYVDENGNARTGGSTISEFETAIQQASTNESPNPENDVEDINDEPVTLELMNWDELLQTNPEEFFKEVQMRFGNSAINFLKEEIEYTKREINSLKGQIGNTLHERAMTSLKIDELQSKINTLSSMVSRLDPAPQNEVESAPVAPETPIAEAPLEPAPEPVEETPIEAPVAETPVEPVEDTPVEPEVAPETPVEETPVAPAEQVEETPIQPEPQATPVAPTPVDNPIEVAKKWEETLTSLINRKGIAKEIKIDSARHIGRVIADLFATREEYEAYEAEAADLGEYLSYFDEGVNESFAVRNNQQNTGETPINSVPLENEPNGENNGEQETGEVGTGRHTNIGIQGTTVGEGQGEDKGDKGEKGSKSQGTNNKGTKEVEDKYPARKGNATPDLLVKTFGLESVNLPKSKNGQKALNSIYDFLMEMSKMLGISPTSIGQGGWLELRNLRGNAGRSAAHNIRDIFGDIIEVYIELKSSRLSSIAHEWFHSLDRALSYFNTGRLHAGATESLPQTFDGRPEVLAAMDDIIRAIEDSGHPKRIQSIGWPRKHKTYLLRLREMAARAFEQYIEDKFAAAGITIENYKVNNDNLQQPTPEEMAVIAPAFDKLFEVLQEKEGKTPGTSVLFQIGEMVDKNTEASQLATENIINVLRDSKIEVVKLTDENVEQMIPLSKVDGTIYGWTDGKKIYLTEAGINPNTPIHEYTHLWAKAMMQNNPKGWQSVKDLLRGTAIWDEVMNDTNYSNIHNDEDAVASEALSRISGRDGAAKMEQMAQQMIDEAKGTARKLEARGLIQRMKDALNKFWSWVGTNLFKIEKFESVEQVTDRVLWDLMNATDLGELSEGQVETQIVTDPKVIAELEASPKRTGYRNVVMNDDGTFSSPMAYWLQSTKGGAKTRVETAKFELGKWEEAEENTDLVDERGHITLVKPNKGTIDVAYDPYIHNRLDPVNIQFKDAWKRNDLVYVETEVPETDLESGYHADKALLSVGVHSWSNGDVMLSKYDKPVRVMPWEEVADAWVARLNGEGVHFDVVPPALLPLLVDRGVEILPPHKGMGKDCNDAYEAWKKENSDSDALLFRKKMIKDFSNMTDEELYDFLDEYESQYTSYSTDGNAYHNYLKEPNKDIIEAIKKSIISNGIDEVGRSVVFVGDYAYLVDHLKPSELSKDSNGIGIIRKVNISGVEKSEKDLIKESIHAGSVRNRRDVNQWIGAYRAKRELYNRYFGSVEDAEAALVDGGLDWKEFGKRLLSRNEGGVEKGRLSTEIGKEVLTNSTDIQNAAVDFLVGEPRLRAIENAVNAEASKLGVKVTYKTREQMPKGHQNEKGYYNPNTGEIVVCTENATSIADAIQTILHEAVAHKGLRELMGDRFNEFINRVYESLDAETKAKVDARAAAEYGGDTAVAMEEYMATLAESTDFNNDTLWDKIKSIFEDIINAILGRNDIKIGDNELRYILRASYNNMVNPRGMETIRGWAQDQMMREDYGINKANHEKLYRTGIDPEEAKGKAAKEIYETVTFNGFTEIMKAFQSATGFKAKMTAAKVGIRKILNEIQRQNQEAQQAVIAGIEAVQAETGNIPIEDFENYLFAENQSQSRSAAEVEDFFNNYYSPIVDEINSIITSIMESRGKNPKNKAQRLEIYSEITQYLIAKHGLERNALFQNTKGEMRDYSGLTALFGLDSAEFAEAERLAQELVDAFEKEIGDAARDMLWKKINNATTKTLRHSYESGQLSRSQYEQIRDMFEFYIPLRGFDETTAEDVYNYANYDGNSFQSAVIRADGRISLAFDPIPVIMNMAQSEIIQGNKNRVKQALYYFVRNRPNSLLTIRDCWYVKNDATNAWEEAYPDTAKGETWEAFEERMKKLSESKPKRAIKRTKGLDISYRFQKPANKNEHYIHVKINGVEHAIVVNGNPVLAKSVNGYKKKQVPLIEGAKKLNRWNSQLYTNYSYKFGGRNFFRDFLEAYATVSIKEPYTYKLRFAKYWALNNPVMIGSLMRHFTNGTLDMSNEQHRLFKEFVENGGKTGYVFIDELGKQKRRIDRAIEQMTKIGNAKTNVATKAMVLLGVIQYVNECIELTARFAVYVTSRNTKDKDGNPRSIMQAIDDAKSVTTNFNRKGAQDGEGMIGSLAYVMGAWNMFFNAQVQGIQKWFELLRKHPLKGTTYIGTWVGLAFALPFIIDIFRGDDDDDENEQNPYFNLPEYQRKNNICIPFGNGKVTMTIPLNPTTRDIYAIGVTLSDAYFNKSVDKDFTMIAMECANHLAKAVVPANPLEGASVGLTIGENIIMFGSPDFADPIVEWVINKDYKGAPIEYRTSYNEGAPHYTKVIGKDKLSARIGEKLWKAGEDNLDSWLDINVSGIEHGISGIAGGIGVLIKDVTNTIKWVTEWQAPERIDDIPVARTLFSSNAMDDERFVNNTYWEMDKIFNKKTRTMKQVYGLTPAEAFDSKKGRSKANLVKVYEATAYPFLEKYYRLNKRIIDKYELIEKMPERTEEEKNRKTLREQELFNMKRDLVYKLLEYEVE